MCFVGREKETKKIIKLLERGHNVILTGKFGIGRTALMKHIADVTEAKWRFFFVDYSQTPGQAIKQLSAQLLPGKKTGIKGNYLRYKSGRFLVTGAALKIKSEDKQNPVLVLDNIAKLTPQKLQFIRYLVQENSFQFVAIIESFLPKEEWFLLRAALLPAEVIILPYLNEESTKKLLRHCAERYSFHWSDQRINMLASTNRGYPLGVHESIQRELDMRKKNGFGQ